MQLLSKFNKGIHFFIVCYTYFSKYAWVISLEDEKVITITNAFQKILDESGHKPNTTWVDKGNDFKIDQ